MNKFWQWLVYSSADPNQLGLTIKGFLLGLIPAVSIIIGLAHINVGPQQLTDIVDTIVATVQTLLTVVSLVLFLLGLWRKLLTTYKGQNAVLNQPTDPQP